MAKKRPSRKNKTYNIKCTVSDNVKCKGSGGAFYFLGFIAALVYYISTATTFWGAVVGFLKAIVWPAFLVYGAMIALAL